MQQLVRTIPCFTSLTKCLNIWLVTSITIPWTYSRYNQILIALEDQEKTTFTCSIGTFTYRLMPFSLCNALATFHIACWVFYLIWWNNFWKYSWMISQFMETHSINIFTISNLFFNVVSRKIWHQTGVMPLYDKTWNCLGSWISKSGIEVDKAMTEVLAKLPVPKCVKNIRSLLWHAGFYRRFIKDFSKIARLLTNLLTKGVSFTFNSEFLNAWEKLKNELISVPIISAPDWSKQFEIMCDSSDFAIGAILGQRIDNKEHVIYYPSRTLNDAQLIYTTTNKEFLAVVFALEKFYDLHRSFCAKIPYGEKRC